MSNQSALLAIYTAVYGILSGDATLVALVDEILNYEPEEPPRKFIVIGSGTELAWNTLGGTDQGWGFDDTLTVHIYSYYKGDIEALQILNRVTTLLNKPEGFPVGSYGTVIAEYGDKLTKVLLETKDKQERRHIAAVFSIKVRQ